VSADPRIAAAERALVEHGVHGAQVEVEGHEREIAALRVPESEWARMMGPDGIRVADAVKAAGFRYVALDLLAADAEPGGAYDSDGEEEPAGWDAFEPPDDAAPREVHPPPTAGESRAEFRAFACLFLGLTALEVVRAALSPDTPWLPFPGIVIQSGMSALAGYDAKRNSRRLLSLPFGIIGVYLIARMAVESISGPAPHALVTTSNQLVLHSIPLAAAALAGGLLAVRRRRAAVAHP
jgi:hypothetical protein